MLLIEKFENVWAFSWKVLFFYVNPNTGVLADFIGVWIFSKANLPQSCLVLRIIKTFVKSNRKMSLSSKLFLKSRKEVGVPPLFFADDSKYSRSPKSLISNSLKSCNFHVLIRMVGKMCFILVRVMMSICIGISFFCTRKQCISCINIHR